MGNGWRLSRLLSPQTSSFDGFYLTQRLRTQIGYPTGTELVLSGSLLCVCLPLGIFLSSFPHPLAFSFSFRRLLLPFGFFMPLFLLTLSKFTFLLYKTCGGNKWLKTASAESNWIFVLLLFSSFIKCTFLFGCNYSKQNWHWSGDYGITCLFLPEIL